MAFVVTAHIDGPLHTDKPSGSIVKLTSQVHCHLHIAIGTYSSFSRAERAIGRLKFVWNDDRTVCYPVGRVANFIIREE